MEFEKKLLEIGVKIKENRINKGYTQDKLVILSGVNRRTLQKIENGQVNFNFKAIYSICMVLNLTLSELFED